MTTQPLTRQRAISDLAGQPAIMEERKRGNSLAIWGFLMMFIGLAIGVIGKMLLHQELITVIGVLVSLLGMFLTAYPYLSTSRRQKSDSNSASPERVLTSSKPARRLPQESHIEYVPSITEKTTDLLQHSTVNRPGKKDAGEL